MNLELAILHVLTASPRALRAKVIRGFLPSFLGRDVALGDIQRALTRLENKGDANGTDTGEEDEHGVRIVVYKETADGRLRVL